jgi:hypothetical protein
VAWLAEDELGDRAGRLLVQAGQHVAIGVHGDGDVGVPEALADDLGRDPSRQRGGGVAVPNVMQADLGEPSGGGVLLEPPREPLWCSGRPSGQVNTSPESSPRGPTASRSSSCQRRWSRKAATVAGSSAIERRPLVVFG